METGLERVTPRSSSECDIPPPRQGISRLAPPYAILVALVCLSLLICGGLLVYGSGRGMDLTDEVFYLVWTRNPDAFALIYQPFGYLLHPLFRLVGGDLQTYRLAGFAIAATAGACLGCSLSRTRANRALFSVYGAASALTIFFPWIITPSYNSAANVGAMLVIAGILNAFANRPALRLAGAVAAAAGLCLAAFSKPPLYALALAVMSAAPIVAKRAQAFRVMIAALLLAAVLISALLPPAQIVDLVERMEATQHILALTNTPLALPAKLIKDWGSVPPALSGAVIAALSSLALRRFRWFGSLGYVAIALSLYHVWDVSADALDGYMPDFIGLTLVTIAAGYAGLMRDRRDFGLPLIGLLLAAPLAVALGTFNNQWAQLNFSMAFPFLAIFVLASADPATWRRAAALALCVLGPPGLMLLAACYPYSLPASIFEQQIAVEHPLTHGSILVDPETAGFVRSAGRLAPGTLLIDLSGTGPGVNAVLGGRAAVLEWLNPATPSWPDVVWSRLSAEERERAWFVGPVWPLFDRSAPARWLAAHRAGYCGRTLPPITVWGEERILQVWRPCNRPANHPVAPA
ncbi:MAG: hypothetical protein JWP15_1517 [Alphaproteobacteria bacterium]|nr:hypothetical protein [Alphaproteobacteria bacterium]